MTFRRLVILLIFSFCLTGCGTAVINQVQPSDLLESNLYNTVQQAEEVLLQQQQEEFDPAVDGG